jgi:hypothetical protein
MDEATVVMDGTITLASGTSSVAGTVTLGATGLEAIFSPTAALPNGSIITGKILSSVKDLAGNPLAQDFTWSFQTVAAAPPPPPDTTAPTVAAVVPANGETNVAVDTPITITFDEAMDPASVNDTSITLASGATALVTTVSLSIDGRTATLMPSGLLPYGSTLTLTVTVGVEDLAGNPMQAAFTSTFQTAVDAPTLVQFIPAANATGVDFDSPITLHFSKPMDPATINPNIEVLVSAAPFPGLATLSIDGLVATFTPFSPFPPNETVQVTIATGVRDLLGVNLDQEYQWSFQTMGELAYTATRVDGTSVKVTFDQPVNASGDDINRYSLREIRIDRTTLQPVEEIIHPVVARTWLDAPNFQEILLTVPANALLSGSVMIRIDDVYNETDTAKTSNEPDLISGHLHCALAISWFQLGLPGAPLKMKMPDEDEGKLFFMYGNQIVSYHINDGADVLDPPVVSGPGIQWFTSPDFGNRQFYDFFMTFSEDALQNPVNELWALSNASVSFPIPDGAYLLSENLDDNSLASVSLGFTMDGAIDQAAGSDLFDVNAAIATETIYLLATSTQFKSFTLDGTLPDWVSPTISPLYSMDSYVDGVDMNLIRSIALSGSTRMMEAYRVRADGTGVDFDGANSFAIPTTTVPSAPGGGNGPERFGLMWLKYLGMENDYLVADALENRVKWVHASAGIKTEIGLQDPDSAIDVGFLGRCDRPFAVAMYSNGVEEWIIVADNQGIQFFFKP